MQTGYILADLRSAKGLSQAELAKQIGTSQASVGHWEADRRNIPQEKLVQLSEYFNVSIDYLLGNTKSKRRYYDLTEKDEKSIEKTLEKLVEELDNGLYSKDMEEYDEDSRELLINALSMGLSVAKKEAKRKFTPKKYRD